jgi:hypothetical protein
MGVEIFSLPISLLTGNLKMRFILIIAFILLCGDSLSSQIVKTSPITLKNQEKIDKNNQIIEDYINSKVNNPNNHAALLIAMDINSCYNCNSPKINGLFSSFKSIDDSLITVLVVESEIPGDAFSLKRRFNVDFFYEDTTNLFSSNELLFPNILIYDKYSNKNILQFSNILKNFESVKNLITPSIYSPANNVAINESDSTYFSIVTKAILTNENVIFHASRRNQILNFNLNSLIISEFFTPQENYIYDYTNVDKHVIDSLKFNGFLNINFLFNIKSFDYCQRRKEFSLLIDKLSDVEITTDDYGRLMLMYKKYGLFSFSHSDTIYNEFLIKNYVYYDEYTRSNSEEFIKFRYGSDYEINDTLALILKIKDRTKFDTLIRVRDLGLSSTHYNYSINDLIDKITAYNSNQLYLLSNILKCIYKFDTSLIKLELKGISQISSDIEIEDFIILNDRIFLIAFIDSNRLLLQSYSLNGDLLSEKLYYICDDLIYSTQFVHNTNSIILLNKWRSKRWTLDFVEF